MGLGVFGEFGEHALFWRSIAWLMPLPVRLKWLVMKPISSASIVFLLRPCPFMKFESPKVFYVKLACRERRRVLFGADVSVPGFLRKASFRLSSLM